MKPYRAGQALQRQPLLVDRLGFSPEIVSATATEFDYVQTSTDLALSGAAYSVLITGSKSIDFNGVRRVRIECGIPCLAHSAANLDFNIFMTPTGLAATYANSIDLGRHHITPPGNGYWPVYLVQYKTPPKGTYYFWVGYNRYSGSSISAKGTDSPFYLRVSAA